MEEERSDLSEKFQNDQAPYTDDVTTGTTRNGHSTRVRGAKTDLKIKPILVKKNDILQRFENVKSANKRVHYDRLILAESPPP